MYFSLKMSASNHFWHNIGNNLGSSDLFKEYLSKLLLETGPRGIRPVSFFLYIHSFSLLLYLHNKIHNQKNTVTLFH